MRIDCLRITYLVNINFLTSRMCYTGNSKFAWCTAHIITRNNYEKNYIGDPYRWGAWIGVQLFASVYRRYLIAVCESPARHCFWRDLRWILRFRRKRCVDRYKSRRTQLLVVQFFRNVHAGKF